MATDYDAVANAAAALVTAGQTPSIRAVVRELKGGSPNVVLRHLRTWKAAQSAVQDHPAMPSRVASDLAGIAPKVWELALGSAQAEVAEAHKLLKDQLAKALLDLDETGQFLDWETALAAQARTSAEDANRHAAAMEARAKAAERALQDQQLILQAAQITHNDTLAANNRLGKENGDLREERARLLQTVDDLRFQLSGEIARRNADREAHSDECREKDRRLAETVELLRTSQASLDQSRIAAQAAQEQHQARLGTMEERFVALASSLATNMSQIEAIHQIMAACFQATARCESMMVTNAGLKDVLETPFQILSSNMERQAQQLSARLGAIEDRLPPPPANGVPQHE
jgi:hypothetical protein